MARRLGILTRTLLLVGCGSSTTTLATLEGVWILESLSINGDGQLVRVGVNIAEQASKTTR